MQLIGQPIKHEKFGKGIVTDLTDTVITICFPAGEKILFDIKELPLCDQSKKCAEEFYEYYCKLNRLQSKHKEGHLLANNC